jgi:hypothetical protein
MKDLVTIIKDRMAMLKMGFKMESDDEPEEKDKRYSEKGISQYTKITSSSNPGYVLGRRI